MGNWTIVIHGIGAHHNGKEFDADVMTDAFVRRLATAGQNVEAASFTSGGRLDFPTKTEPSDSSWQRQMEALDADNATLLEAVRKVAEREGPLAESAAQFLQQYGKAHR